MQSGPALQMATFFKDEILTPIHSRMTAEEFTSVQPNLNEGVSPVSLNEEGPKPQPVPPFHLPSIFSPLGA